MIVAADRGAQAVAQALLNRFLSQETNIKTARSLFEDAWSKIKARDILFYIKSNRSRQAKALYEFARTLVRADYPNGAAWQLLMPDINNQCSLATLLDLPSDHAQLILVRRDSFSYHLIPIDDIQKFGRLASPYSHTNTERKADKLFRPSKPEGEKNLEEKQIRDKHPRIYSRLKEDGSITPKTLQQLIKLVEATIQVGIDTPAAKQGQIEMAWSHFFIYYEALSSEERQHLNAVKLYLRSEAILLGDRLAGIKKGKECTALTAKALARLVFECSRVKPTEFPYAQGKHIQRKFLPENQRDFALGSRLYLVDRHVRRAYSHEQYANFFPAFLTRAFLETYAGDPEAIGYSFKHFMGLAYFSQARDEQFLAKVHVIFNASFGVNPINLTSSYNLLLFFTEFVRCSIECFFQAMRDGVRYYKDRLSRGARCCFLMGILSVMLSALEVCLLVPSIFVLKAVRHLWRPLVEPLAALTDPEYSVIVTAFKFLHTIAFFLCFKNASHVLLNLALEGEEAMSASSAISALSLAFSWEKLGLSDLRPMAGPAVVTAVIIGAFSLFSAGPGKGGADTPEIEEKQLVAH